MTDDPDSERGSRLKGVGFIAIVLGLGALLYTASAVLCAGYLLYQAFQTTNSAQGNPSGSNPPQSVVQSTTAPQNGFNTLAISGLIAVIGTGLTGLASLYSATLQANTTARVAEYSAKVGTETNDMKGALDKELAAFRRNADEALAVFKVSLDVAYVAHLELFGNANIFFHVIRAAALGFWDEEGLKAAQAGMIGASRHLLNVDGPMRAMWFEFWQRGEVIYRLGLEEKDPVKRTRIVTRRMLERVQPRGKSGNNFRGMHAELENVAKAELKRIANNGADKS